MNYKFKAPIVNRLTCKSRVQSRKKDIRDFSSIIKNSLKHMDECASTGMRVCIIKPENVSIREDGCIEYNQYQKLYSVLYKAGFTVEKRDYITVEF